MNEHLILRHKHVRFVYSFSCAVFHKDLKMLLFNINRQVSCVWNVDHGKPALGVWTKEGALKESKLRSTALEHGRMSRKIHKPPIFCSTWLRGRGRTDFKKTYETCLTKFNHVDLFYNWAIGV